MERTRLRFALALCLSPSLAACGASQGSHPADPQVETAVSGGSLYERLGGREGIHAISDTFLKKLKADARIGSFFKQKSGLARLEEQLCQLSGGPCRYSGKDMKTAHEGIGITDAQFDAFMEDFKSALSERSVSPREQSELVAALAPMRAAIVEKKETK